MACKKALFLDSLRERLLAEGLIEMKTERTPTEGQLSMVVSSGLQAASSLGEQKKTPLVPRI